MKLIQYQVYFNGINASPFCQKLESFMRLHQLPFESGFEPPQALPTQKLPALRHKGELWVDSDLILDRLEAEFEIDERLSPNERAIGHAWQRLAEEHLYWAMVHFRWNREPGWQGIRQHFFAGLDESMAEESRHYMGQCSYFQGISRLGDEQILAKSEKDLSQLEAWMSDRDYLCADHLCRYDLAVWAVLANLLVAELAIPLAAQLKSMPNLMAYCQRVSSQALLAADESVPG